jgi:hypothetical protein
MSQKRKQLNRKAMVIDEETLRPEDDEADFAKVKFR